MAITPAIRTQDLSRQFGEVQALQSLSIEVPTGIVFGFLGPNGSGKTTTIRLLLGLLEPTSGRAEVMGLDTRTQADQIRQQCGALLENTGLYDRLTALDNLEYYGRIWRIPTSERKSRIREALENIGLWDRRNEAVVNWSRGMKQKLAVARAMLHHPKLIFLDEPTAGLDPVAAAALRDDLAALASRSGVTVFLTTHNLSEAEKLCSQVAVIRRGQLLSIGSPDLLRRQTGKPHAEVYGRGFNEDILAKLRAQAEVASAELVNNHLLLEFKSDTDTAPLVTMMVTNGVQIEEIRRGKASLEDVFLTLMEEEK